jgi:geranylgeranyl diphosphate synthase type II
MVSATFSTEDFSTQDLVAYLAEQRAVVDAALERALPPAETVPDALHRAMRHSVFAGGKRLRPMLVIAGAEAIGTAADSVLPAACAVEMIHTYSLIHDDLPAFDDEELRRGQPTSHVLFGETVAILAGDALQALAFEHMASAGSASDHPAAWVAAIRELSFAAGSRGMCGGQTLDTEAAGEEIDMAGLQQLHAAKTGALLTASVVMGGTLAGAGPEQLAALRQYGDAVGLAFQIVDDLLDVEGDVEDLGKRPGGDAERGQPTFPVLIGIDGAHREAERLRVEARAALAPFGDSAAPLAALADYIVNRSR